MTARILAICLSLAILFLMFYGYPVVARIWRNAALTGSVKAEKVEWSGQEIHSEEWRPKVHFYYQVQGKQYENEELFEGYRYRNLYALESDLKRLKEEYLTVWYAPRNPANSSLEKYFPTKRAIYTGILFTILFYIIMGGFYYTRYLLNQNQKPK